MEQRGEKRNRERLQQPEQTAKAITKRSVWVSDPTLSDVLKPNLQTRESVRLLNPKHSPCKRWRCCCTLQGRWSGRRYRNLHFQRNQEGTHMRHLHTQKSFFTNCELNIQSAQYVHLELSMYMSQCCDSRLTHSSLGLRMTVFRGCALCFLPHYSLFYESLKIAWLTEQQH